MQIKSFEFKGQADSRLEHFGVEAVVSCLLLCLSTASISDGGDLNYDFYFYGSRGYWAITLFLIWKSSNIFISLWSIKPGFIPEWSFHVKSYSGIVSILLVVCFGLHYFSIIDFGYLLEWFISFFILFYVLTLYWDLKNMDILLRRK